MAVRRRMRVLIAGGGIGGLTAGHALRHAGLDVAVFERANDLRTIRVGGTIVVWSTAPHRPRVRPYDTAAWRRSRMVTRGSFENCSRICRSAESGPS